MASVNTSSSVCSGIRSGKALLRKLLLRHAKAVLYVDHVASSTDLFRVVCERDMEGIVAKQASARYTPEATT
jgi:ATP-dependent DNA ligase